MTDEDQTARIVVELNLTEAEGEAFFDALQAKEPWPLPGSAIHNVHAVPHLSIIMDRKGQLHYEAAGIPSGEVAQILLQIAAMLIGGKVNVSRPDDAAKPAEQTEPQPHSVPEDHEPVAAAH